MEHKEEEPQSPPIKQLIFTPSPLKKKKELTQAQKEKAERKKLRESKKEFMRVIQELKSQGKDPVFTLA